MSNVIRPRRPISEAEKREASEIFGDLVSKLDQADKQPPLPPKKGWAQRLGFGGPSPQ